MEQPRNNYGVTSAWNSNIYAISYSTDFKDFVDYLTTKPKIFTEMNYNVPIPSVAMAWLSWLMAQLRHLSQTKWLYVSLSSSELAKLIDIAQGCRLEILTEGIP